MSDFEMLSIVLSILSIILMILIAYINEKVTATFISRLLLTDDMN